MNLPQLIEEFGTEDKCIEALAELRWPNGVTCPKCESTNIGKIETRKLFDCAGCGYQFSVRVGTVLQDSKLPLWKWFLATLLLVEAEKGMSANQLARTLGVTAKTGWYLSHRIRAAMIDDGVLRSDTVEVDETYVGGKVRGMGSHYTGYKAIVVGAVERGGNVKFGITRSRDGKALGDFVRANVDDSVKFVYTDGHDAYKTIPELRDEDTTHEFVNHRQEDLCRLRAAPLPGADGLPPTRTPFTGGRNGVGDQTDVSSRQSRDRGLQRSLASTKRFTSSPTAR